ncbi:unnamed protein product [Alternaria alternata]
MARQSDANSLQPPSPLFPRQDVQSNEPFRPQPQRSGANRNVIRIELRKSTFYNKDVGNPQYSARDMPYESNHEQIGEGAHAKVYKSTVKGGFYNAGQGLIATDYQVARKEFSGIRAKDNFLIENKICRDFYDATSGITKTIVAPLFSYAVKDLEGGVSYNICYELAACDLQTYLSDDSNFPRGKSRARVAHIEQMLRVAEGLKWLMETTTKEGGLFRALGFTHCDLHWRNILLCEDENHPGSLIFKIGDFGSARTGRDLENDQRSRVALVERINGQFSAPEPETHGNGDVWSFGCNLLLVLVFNYYGVGGINEFLASLLRHSNQDWFYDRITRVASNETTSCMNHLRRRVEHDADRLVTVGLLNLLQNSILVPTKNRISISEVVTALQTCLREQQTVVPKVMVERANRCFEYCFHAPGGRFEMFRKGAGAYTMSVWTWNHGIASELPFLEPITGLKQGRNMPEQGRISPCSSCCGEEHICQVIATSNTLELLLYQVPKIPGDPIAREYISLTDLKDVSRVALAPNAKYIAIDADRKLRLYERQQLLDSMKL